MIPAMLRCLPLLMVAVPLAAQPRPAPLTVHEAVAHALAHHPSVAAAARAVEAAQAGRREAAAARWPALRLEASATRFEEPMVVAPLHGINPQEPPLFDRTLVQASLGASYLLLDGGRREARVEGEEAHVRLRSAEESGAVQRVVAEVVQAWLAVSAGRELRAAEEERLAALQAERDRAVQFLEAGRAALVEQRRAAAALAEAEASLVARAEEVAHSERTLARLTGLDAGMISRSSLAHLQPRGNLPAAPEAYAVLRTTSPEILRARARVEAAASAEAAARGNWWPEVRLQAGYTDYASGEGRLSGEWMAGVRASYTLFTGGARAGASARAGGERAAAEAELAALELRLEDAVDAALAAARSAAARVSALVAAVAQHAEVTRIEQLALDAGAGTQAEYLRAQAALLGARAQLIQARHAEVAARIELARVQGVLTPRSLTSLLEMEP